MTDSPFDNGAEAIAALRDIVAEYGPDVLSCPGPISALLRDLLPESQRIRRILVAAAEDHIADALREHVAQGMDPVIAARLAASAFAEATLFTPEACAWVIGALAVALGLTDRPPTIVVRASPESMAHIGGLPQQQSAWRAATTAGALAEFGKTAYVANAGDGTITPIDLTDKPVRAKAPIKVGAAPTGIAITPDGKTAYVANSGAGMLTPVTLGASTRSAPIRVGNAPTAIAITPDGKTACTANADDNTVTLIDLAAATCRAPIQVGNRPIAIAITPDGKTAWVANFGTCNVTAIDLATAECRPPVKLMGRPAAIAISPDSMTAYVVTPAAKSSGGLITPIDIPTNAADTPIIADSTPTAIAISPDGITAYVTQFRVSNDGIVTPVDLVTNRLRTPIPLGMKRYPSAIAITPDGMTAYVVTEHRSTSRPDSSGTVTPIDLATGKRLPRIEVGRRPAAIAISW